MTELVFGISYSLQEKEEFRYVVASIAGSNVRTGTLCQAPILQWRRLDRHLFQTSILARNRFMGFVDRLMRDRMNAKNIHGDVFSLLLKAKDPNTGQVLDSRQLGAESVNLIVAGKP
jgi:cytochrome P450